MNRDDDNIPLGKDEYLKGLTFLVEDSADKVSHSSEHSMLPFKPYESDPETIARLDAMVRPDLNDEQFNAHLERLSTALKRGRPLHGLLSMDVGFDEDLNIESMRGTPPIVHTWDYPSLFTPDIPRGGFRHGQFITQNALTSRHFESSQRSYREGSSELEKSIQALYNGIKLTQFVETVPRVFGVDYYKQFLGKGGGYRKQKSWDMRFINVPKVFESPYLYPELDVITSTRIVPRDQDPYISVSYKGLEVGGKIIKEWPRFPDYQAYDYCDSLTEMCIVDRNVARDKEGYLRDPMPSNPNREEWVEKAMWEMGMSRSRYNPTFKDRFPHVNVGTIGHKDHGRILYYTGKDNNQRRGS